MPMMDSSGDAVPGRPLVVIADDVEDVRVLVRFELEYAGFSVVEAAGGQEAIDEARRCRPDLLLLDLDMPDVDGWSVLRQLRSDGILDAMRVAVLTGTPDEIVERRARSGGACAFIVKPVSGADLARTLRRALELSTAPAGVA